MIQHGRHSKAKPHYWLGAGIAAVLLLAVVASSRWWTADGGEPAAAAAGADRTPAAAAAEAPFDTAVDDAIDAAASGDATSDDAASDDGQTAVTAAVESCRAQHAAQTPALHAAERSLQQWRTHVEAMNKLVAGEITLDQASTFWEQTRVGAADRVQRFSTDDGAYRDSDSSCPWVTDELRPGDAPALQQCRQATAARDDQLAAARVAVATWGHHVHDMERLRAGTLSPERATQLWLRSWRKGVDELDAYTATARTAGTTTC